jgi:protein FRA10AC1
MPNEFEILKASHKCVSSCHPRAVAHISDRFLREDEPEKDASASWGDQLARKYYDNLYREFALCNLKHYKTGNVRSLNVGAMWVARR